MKTASSLSWRPIADLSDDLVEQLRTDATLEVRRDGVRRSDRRWQLMLIPGLTGLIAGVMAGALIPSGPLPSPLRLGALVLGAVSFAVWLAWFRGRSERPLAGQGVLLTPSTLVVVDHTSVAVVRAEHVDVDHGNLLIAKELIHRADEIFLDQLAAAQAADLETRKADPWRPLAGAAGGRPVPTPRTRRLGRAALYGLAAAIALEALFALAVGWPAAAARDGAWAHSQELVGKQLDQIDRYQERAFVEQMGEATTTGELTGLVVQAVELGESSDRAKRVLQRYRLLLSDELAAASSRLAVLQLINHTLALELPDDFTVLARERLAALVTEQTSASTEVRELVAGLDDLASGGVEGPARDALLARLATLAEATAENLDLDSAAHLYHSMIDGVPEDHPMRVAILRRARELTASQLLEVQDTGTLYRGFARLRILIPDPEIKAMIDGRFEALMREQVNTVHDTELLLSYYELRLNHEFNQFLTRRFEELARDEIRRARSADEIDHFRQEAEVLGLSDEFKQLLEDRLRQLGEP